MLPLQLGSQENEFIHEGFASLLMAFYPESNIQLSRIASFEGWWNSHPLPLAKHTLLLWLGNGFPFQSRSKTCGSLCFPPRSLKPEGTELLPKLVLAARTKILGLKKMSPQIYMLYSTRVLIILMGQPNRSTPFHQYLKMKELMMGHGPPPPLSIPQGLTAEPCGLQCRVSALWPQSTLLSLTWFFNHIPLGFYKLKSKGMPLPSPCTSWWNPTEHKLYGEGA